jgi:hypothetical protein
MLPQLLTQEQIQELMQQAAERAQGGPQAQRRNNIAQLNAMTLNGSTSAENVEHETLLVHGKDKKTQHAEG